LSGCCSARFSGVTVAARLADPGIGLGRAAASQDKGAGLGADGAASA
jgi:hypothetical protein